MLCVNIVEQATEEVQIARMAGVVQIVAPARVRVTAMVMGETAAVSAEKAEGAEVTPAARALTTGHGAIATKTAMMTTGGQPRNGPGRWHS